MLGVVSTPQGCTNYKVKKIQVRLTAASATGTCIAEVLENSGHRIVLVARARKIDQEAASGQVCAWRVGVKVGNERIRIRLARVFIEAHNHEVSGGGGICITYCTANARGMRLYCTCVVFATSPLWRRSTSSARELECGCVQHRGERVPEKFCSKGVGGPARSMITGTP